MDTRLLTLAQAAEYLNVSPRSLWRAVQLHEVAVVRMGRLLRFDLADLDHFVGARRIGATGTRGGQNA